MPPPPTPGFNYNLYEPGSYTAPPQWNEGDLYWQCCPVINVQQVGGDVPETNYLFMGDFVDRGFYSVETFLLLLALKVNMKLSHRIE